MAVWIWNGGNRIYPDSRRAGSAGIWMGLETERCEDAYVDDRDDAGTYFTLDGAADRGCRWPGGWMLLSDCRMLSGEMADAGTFDGGCVCEQSAGMYLDGCGAAWRKGEWLMGTNAEKEASVPAVCDPGMDLDAGGICGMKQEVYASYTVEASFVMAITLFFIAALLNGVFEVHGRITGRFVLQEALERCLYREEKSLRGNGATVKEVSGKGQQYLRGFFRCGDAVLTIREDGSDLEGMVKSSTETSIYLRGQDPERAIRLLTVVENSLESAGMAEKTKGTAE